MDRERVAVVTESFLPTVNGVTTSVARILDHLADTGHEALVIAPDAGGGARYRRFPVVGVPAITYRRFPVGLPNPRLSSILGDFAPTVLHAASPFLLGAQAVQTARRLGVPSVAVYQTDVAGYARRNGLGAMADAAWALVRAVHNAADLTLAPSTAAVEDLLRAGVQRVRMWRRGVDLDGFHPRNRDAPSSRALRFRVAADSRVVVGYVGRLAPEKGLGRLLALQRLPGIRVLLVGDGPSMPALREQLAPLRPVFLGEQHGPDLAAAYAAMDVFVHTGTHETFGQTLQEAAATGLPCVAPAVGGPLDLVDDAVTGLLYDPGRPRDLLNAVSVLVRRPALRAAMGEAARRAVLSRTWAAVGGELLAHYRSVQTGAPRSRAGLSRNGR